MLISLAQDPYFKNPSDEEPFQDIIKYWMRDKVFAEQRLAGVNPMTLMRVTTDRGKQIRCRLSYTSHIQHKETQLRYFDLFWPHTKLPLNLLNSRKTWKQVCQHLVPFNYMIFSYILLYFSPSTGILRTHSDQLPVALIAQL